MAEAAADIRDDTGTARLEVVPVAGRIGAEIRGVDLAMTLAPQVIEAIRAAFLRHKVIFFRDQHELTDPALERFLEHMGTPMIHPNGKDPHGSRFLVDLTEDAGYASSAWHTDLTYLPVIPAATVLHALEMPESGGDTMWANTAAAYTDLPEALRAMADRLWALHGNISHFDAHYSGELRQRVDRMTRNAYKRCFEAMHPVVHVHPETGERALLLGWFVTRFADFNQFQSNQIFTLLQDIATRPENCVRWRWRTGDVAMWDNRATLHRAVADFGEQQRHLRRGTIAGTVTVGIDGREGYCVTAPEQTAGTSMEG